MFERLRSTWAEARREWNYYPTKVKKEKEFRERMAKRDAKLNSALAKLPQIMQTAIDGTKRLEGYPAFLMQGVNMLPDIAEQVALMAHALKQSPMLVANVEVQKWCRDNASAMAKYMTENS